MSWYYARQNRQFGPVDLAHVQELVASGSLSPDDLVWSDGFDAWLAVREVSELGQAANAAEVAPQFGNHVRPRNAYSTTFLSFGAAPARATAYAGFWRRAAALAVDALIFLALSLIAAAALLSFNPSLLDDWETSRGWSALTFFLLGWLYWAGFEASSRQGTPGKAALGILVANAAAGRLSLVRATVRHLGRFLSALLFGSGFLLMVFSERRQCFHDVLANSIVLRRR